MKRLILKHEYKVKHITNPYIAGGNVVTDYLPYNHIKITTKLMDVGEAEITFPNGWRRAGGGKDILTRTQFDKGDIIEIWRDKELIFSGLVFKNIKLTLDTVVISLVSHIWLLTQQYTRKESYTEEPADTVKRFLKGKTYALHDNFNRDDSDDPGSLWTEVNGDWDIVSNQLKLISGGGPEEGITTASFDLSDGVIISADMDLTTDVVNKGVSLYCPNTSNDMTIFFDTDNNLLAFTAMRNGSSIATYYEFNDTIFYGYGSYIYPSGIFHCCWQIYTTISGSNTRYHIKIWMDDELKYFIYFDTATSGDPFTNGKLVLAGANGDVFDNISLQNSVQLIAEGDIDNYGSNKTTSVSYETLFNAIHQRVKPQLSSTDDLATTWEWKENPVAHDVDNPTAPHASLDFKNRVGTDRDITLSTKEENLSNADTTISFDQIKTNLIALGAGTAAVEETGQIMAESVDLDLFDEVGLILTTLYQASDEIDYARLKSMANLWLGKYSAANENMVVDAIDYEKRGFQIGDGYIIDIEQLDTDRSTRYRVLNEERDISPDGAEILNINVKDEKRSFRMEVLKYLREITNKARYPQSGYVDLNYNYIRDDAVAVDAKTTSNKNINFDTGIHASVNKINWNIEVEAGTAVWKLWIDGVDVTSYVFGSSTVTGHKFNQDLTSWMSSIENHTIEIQNKDVAPKNIGMWGVCILERAR